ncbi:hypothetical protein KR054_012581 [Drosophila jambulina]|nr:hypothetical protein KR054_012581 [Drosophila jambulina]
MRRGSSSELMSVVNPLEKCNDEPSQAGPCKAAFPSWRYIRDRQLCEPFLYGGCQATENIFEDEEECRELCLR